MSLAHSFFRAQLSAAVGKTAIASYQTGHRLVELKETRRTMHSVESQAAESRNKECGSKT